MTHDAFSRCHPAVNFLFFVAAIGCGMVIQHPAYILAGVVSGGKDHHRTARAAKAIRRALEELE